MSSHTGFDAQSALDEDDCEGELLCLKIKAQLEDLFSDSHLAEDGFLLKHVQKSKQGYVSLKLLTCLKKIKVLTTNWYMTLAGALSSELLEVNSECKKVRRIEPLPKWLLCSPSSKLLLAWNIVSEERTGARGLEDPSLSERILQKFSAHGRVASFWILEPGKELPKELQCYTKRHKEHSQHVCAVAKFDRLEAVRVAYSALKAEEEKSDGTGMCVVPLGFRSYYQITDKKPPEESKEEQTEENTAILESRPLKPSEDPVLEKSLSVEASSEPPDPSQSQKALTLDQVSNNYPKPVFFSGLNKTFTRTNWGSGDCDQQNSPSPWVLKRKLAAGVLKPIIPGDPKRPCLTVLHQPYGPDGTKGFHGNRGMRATIATG